MPVCTGSGITDPTGAAVFDRTLPVGTLGRIVRGSKFRGPRSDLEFDGLWIPCGPRERGCCRYAGITISRRTHGAGLCGHFAAAAGPVEVWQYASAAAQPGVYGLSLTVAQSNPALSLLSTTRVINPASITSTSYALRSNSCFGGNVQSGRQRLPISVRAAIGDRHGCAKRGPCCPRHRQATSLPPKGP